MKKQQGGVAPALENTDKNQHVPDTENHYMIPSRFKPAVSFTSDYKVIVLIPLKPL